MVLARYDFLHEGIQFKYPLEAAVTFNDGENMVFLGGRENSGDSNKVCWVNLNENPLDLAEFKDGAPCRWERCLHKGIICQDYVIIVGGCDLRNIEVMNKVTKQPMMSIQSEFFKSFYPAISSVHFNDFFLKKCSIA